MYYNNENFADVKGKGSVDSYETLIDKMVRLCPKTMNQNACKKMIVDYAKGLRAKGKNEKEIYNQLNKYNEPKKMEFFMRELMKKDGKMVAFSNTSGECPTFEYFNNKFQNLLYQGLMKNFNNGRLVASEADMRRRAEAEEMMRQMRRDELAKINLLDISTAPHPLSIYSMYKKVKAHRPGDPYFTKPAKYLGIGAAALGTVGAGLAIGQGAKIYDAIQDEFGG